MPGLISPGCSAALTRAVQDFRTGYYTLASPKALFTVQVCGAFLGVLYSPAVFTFYNHAFKSAPPSRLLGRSSTPLGSRTDRAEPAQLTACRKYLSGACCCVLNSMYCPRLLFRQACIEPM